VRFATVFAVALLTIAGVSIGLAQQRTNCRTHVPSVGPALDARGLPFIRNFDPCSSRLTMTDNALNATGGPYISKAEAEQRAVASATPTKVRSYFGDYAHIHALLGITGGSTEIYPDREVWLVVVRAADQGQRPSLKPTVQQWQRRWYYQVLGATSGRLLEEGGNSQDDPDWPAVLPAD
jgi:hypothetical protein